MPDPCFAPRGLAPAGDPLLTPAQWDAIGAFGNEVAKIDVPAMRAELASWLPIRPEPRLHQSAPDDIPAALVPALIARASASVQPCLAILVQLQAAAPPVLESFRSAQALGGGLAAFAQQAVTGLTAVAAEVRRADADPARAVAPLEQMRSIAEGEASAARRASDALGESLRSITGLLTALDASMAAVDSDLATQPGNPASQARGFLASTLLPVNTALQGLAPQLAPGLTRGAGAWNSIALELQSVVAKAQTADAAALQAEPCLAADALAIAADEWRAVAADVDAFLRSLTTTAAVAGVML